MPKYQVLNVIHPKAEPLVKALIDFSFNFFSPCVPKFPPKDLFLLFWYNFEFWFLKSGNLPFFFCCCCSFVCSNVVKLK